MFTPEEIRYLEKIVKSKVAKEISTLLELANQSECDYDVEWKPATSRLGTDPAIIYEHNERMALLSDNAREIITILEKGSQALNNQGKVTKSSLRSYLNNICKWENNIIDATYTELTEFCRGL